MTLERSVMRSASHVAVLCFLTSAAANAEVSFTTTEIDLIAAMRRPAAPPVDPTNALESNVAAAALGRQLFFETRLSRSRKISCATCHDPGRDWSDGRSLGQGLKPLTRRTPTLWNVAYNRWFFWDGRADSLWSQALGPLLSPDEMGGTPDLIAKLVRSDPPLNEAYMCIFGPEKDDARESGLRLTVNVAKCIAAFERTLLTSDAPFDRFVDALLGRPGGNIDSISDSAKRGLQLFIGRGACRNCHHGPMLSDGEFHNIRVPRPMQLRHHDLGRYQGIVDVMSSRFNGAGSFSDDPAAGRAKLVGLAQFGEQWGQFKTPSLRNVANRSHFMHAGQFDSLRAVLEFYSSLDTAEEVGHHEEQVLQPLRLTPGEIADLAEFLSCLTDQPKYRGDFWQALSRNAPGSTMKGINNERDQISNKEAR